MSITSEADWKGLREIGRIVRLALDALERHARAGVSTLNWIEWRPRFLYATERAQPRQWSMGFRGQYSSASMMRWYTVFPVPVVSSRGCRQAGRDGGETRLYG